MKTNAHLTDTALLALIGSRVARMRLARNLTQQELAERAGVGMRTVQRLERGTAALQLSGFVRICRALGVADRLESLFPEEPESPIAQLTRNKHTRQRAAGRRAAETAAKSWNWGDAK